MEAKMRVGNVGEVNGGEYLGGKDRSEEVCFQWWSMEV